MIRQAKQARDEALFEARFFQDALEKRNAAMFPWIQGHATKMVETWVVKNHLVIAESTIEGLRKDNQALGKEIAKLESELSLAKIHIRVADTQLGHIERRGHKKPGLKSVGHWRSRFSQ